MKEQVIIGVLLIIGIILWKQKLPLIFKVIWGFFLLVNVYQCFWPYYEPTFAPAISNILAWNMTQNFFILLAFPIAIFSLSFNQKRILLAILKAIMVCDAVYLITGHNGFFGATTFDATLIALFGLMWFQYEDPENEGNKLANMFGLAISIIGVACVRGRTGALVFAVLAIAQIIQRVKIHVRKPIFYSFLTFIGMICVIGVYLYWPKLINDTRISMWQGFYDWWKINADATIGTGMGSFEWIGPAISPDWAHKDHYGFFVMHNDWLQMGFETGIIGFIISIVGYVAVAVKLQGKYLSTWLALGAAMLFYYPTHAWVTQILALIIIAQACKINFAPEPEKIPQALTDPFEEPILF